MYRADARANIDVTMASRIDQDQCDPQLALAMSFLGLIAIGVQPKMDRFRLAKFRDACASQPVARHAGSTDIEFANATRTGTIAPGPLGQLANPNATPVHEAQ
jgi:hypothetical protein